MDITGVILLTGIGLVIGFLLGALIFSLRKEPPPEQPSQQQRLADSEKSIRVWREGSDQHFVIEMNGVSYRKGSRLNEDQEQFLIQMVGDLQNWVTISPGISAEIEFSPPTSEANIPQTSETSKGTSLNPLKVFGDAMKPLKKPEMDEDEQSIVSQIDKILQSKLEGTTLEERGIRLVEGPDQGMLIEVGLDRYTEIESVPDDQIRQLIRLSVADWERSLGE
jgi:hypothetical protein